MSDRSLPALDLDLIREHVRSWLAAQPDPNHWPRENQWVAALAAEVARLQRVQALAPKGPSSDSTRARLQGYEGTPCDRCGQLTLVRNGPCLLCTSCGSTSGGCS